MYKSFVLIKHAVLEEREHEIMIMTGNISQFVRLIVKECVNRNPVRVWS